MKRFGWFIAVLSGLILSCTPALASELPDGWKQAVMDYVATEMSGLGAPGAAVVIVNGDDVVFAEGFGTAGKSGEPVTRNTPFHLASVSKALTALAVMQLVETGHLDLDVPLGETNFGLNWEELPASEITVRNLLAHTSGWTEIDGLVNRVDPHLEADALERNAQRIAATPLSHSTGDFEYSNANYDLLGYLIERASGESYADYMKGAVFAPLQMTHSFTSEAEAAEAGVADGHYPFFGITRPHGIRFVPGSLPSAFLSSSALDLGHFLLANLNGGRFEDRAVLSPEGMAVVHRPIAHPTGAWDGYAMGWWVFPLWSAGQLVDGVSGGAEYQVPVALDVTGDHESYASSALLIPDIDLGVVVLLNINDESVSSRYHQIHLGIANILLGETPPPTTTYEDPVRRYAKVLALVIVGLFLLRAALSARRLQSISRSGALLPLWPQAVARYFALPLMIDAVLIGSIWWFLAEEGGAPLTLVRRSVPDVVLAASLATIIGLGWGLMRSVYVMRALARSRRGADQRYQPEHPDP